jgi:thiosulfate reductase cytochrome b subunit
MDEVKWVRLVTLAGLAFVILIIVQGPVLHSSAPALTDSSQTVYNYINGHRGSIKASAFLYGLAMSAILIWISVLFRALRRAEGGNSGLALAALAGTGLAAAMSITAAVIEAATALRIQDLNAAGARLFYTMYQFAQGGILFGLAVLVVATGVVCLRTGLFYRWFGVTSVLLAAASIVGAAGIAYANNSVQVIATVMLSLDTLWILVVTGFLLREPELVIP